MVELSPVLAMAAPLDPLSHQLQHHQHNTPTPNTNTNPWGTWEELILGSAVLKHGADNWALVSEELQSRARASFPFTPEACRAGYHAIRLRFGADAGRDGGRNEWYEELRSLRVAHLKREIEQYESSIGSLRTKIRKLQSEAYASCTARSLSAQAQGSELNKVPHEAIVEGDTNESVVCGSRGACNGRTITSDRVQAAGDDALMVLSESHVDMHQATKMVFNNPDPTSTSLMGLDASFACMKQSTVFQNRMHNEATSLSSQQCNNVKELAVNRNGSSLCVKQEEQLPSSSSSLYRSLSKSDTTTSKSMIMKPHKSSDSLATSLDSKHEECDIETRSMETPKRNLDPIESDRLATDTLLENHVGTPIVDKARDDCATIARLTVHQQDTSVKVGYVPHGETSIKQRESLPLKSVNIEECKNMVKSPLTEDDGGDRNSDESWSLCSPRLKSQHAKRPLSGVGIHPTSKQEISAQVDVDAKLYAGKVLGEKSVLETTSTLPVESADSTECKGRPALAVEAESPDALAGLIEKEMMTSKDVPEIAPRLNSTWVEKDNAKTHIVPPTNTQKKNQSSSSTENSFLYEVWGESAEVENKMTRSIRKRRRLMGRVDWKHKPTDSGDARDATDITTNASFIETDSLSHEASESIQIPGGKEEPGTEAWLQAERLSGDSQYEKSEVGSYVDGNEDISPMSRRNKREPKVSGKHIPLLKSLRTICAHRCGHFFRHNQEPEDNGMYYCIVRSPIDLGIIRTKLEEGRYTRSMQFFRDLLLMVSNAMVYYPRDSSEFAAASGLRDCVMQEMAYVFETEALMKQEGPLFRKQGSRQIQGQGRRKGVLKLLSRSDVTSRERDGSVKQSDASTNTESCRMTQQTLASWLSEGGRPDMGHDTKRSVQMGGNVHKPPKSSELKELTSSQTPLDVLSSLKTGLSPLDKGKGVKESRRLSFTLGKSGQSKKPTSSKLPMHTSRDAKLKERSTEDGLKKKPGSARVGSSKALESLSYKGKGSTNFKGEAVPVAVEEPPCKRRVGRPPKHSQQQGLLKAREVMEVSSSTWKRGRR